MISPNEAIDYLLDPIGKREIHDDAVGLAVDALRKQIPKKAVGNRSAYMRCHTCNHMMPSGGSGRNIRRRESWCDHCGQKIDWDRKELN